MGRNYFISNTSTETESPSKLKRIRLLFENKRNVVIDDTFNKTGMQAILIEDDASSWFESGPVRDVTIINNKFFNCGYNLGKNNYTIAIEPENHKLVKDYYVHNNINITNNIFVTSGSPLIIAKSTTNLKFNDKTISVSGNASMRPDSSIIKLTACDKVFMCWNKFVNRLPSVQLTEMTWKSIVSDVRQ